MVLITAHVNQIKSFWGPIQVWQAVISPSKPGPIFCTTWTIDQLKTPLKDSYYSNELHYPCIGTLFLTASIGYRCCSWKHLQLRFTVNNWRMYFNGFCVINLFFLDLICLTCLSKYRGTTTPWHMYTSSSTILKCTSSACLSCRTSGVPLMWYIYRNLMTGNQMSSWTGPCLTADIIRLSSDNMWLW